MLKPFTTLTLIALLFSGCKEKFTTVVVTDSTGSTATVQIDPDVSLYQIKFGDTSKIFADFKLINKSK